MGIAVYPDWMLNAFQRAEKEPRYISAKDLDECGMILYGSFGFHAKEPPEDIIFRKLVETDGSFSLWGGRIGNKENVVDYCRTIAESGQPVYVLLRYTSSRPGGDDLPYTWFFLDNEWKKLSDYNIKVTGKKETNKAQDRAFVVEEYCLFECSVSFSANDVNKGIDARFSKTRRYNKNRKDKIAAQEQAVLLERNGGSRLDDMPEGEENFALILKLKEPYVVDLKR